MLWAEGEVSRAAVCRGHLPVCRCLGARAGESHLVIRDEVENAGLDPTPHVLLLHMSAGWPIVDESSELLAPVTAVELCGNYAAEVLRKTRASEVGYVERVYEHELAAEDGGTAPVGIVNRRSMGRGLYQVYRHGQLPRHLVRRTLGEGTYAVGLEPSTNRAAGGPDARERGDLTELGPNEGRVYDLALGALDREGEIDRFAARVGTLTGS